MTSVAILISCLNRHKLLERSLYMLSRQTVPADIFIIDDGSHPGIEKIALDAGAHYERIRDPILPGTRNTRGPTPGWRHAYYGTDHDFVIISHPEVLVPYDAVERMLDQHQSPRRSSGLLYFLNRPLLATIEDYPWREDLHVLQTMPGFSGVYNRWGLFNRDMWQWKHHVCFSGQTREDWDLHNFLPGAEEFGEADDAWLWGIEDKLSRETGEIHYINQIELVIYHQFHGASRNDALGNDIWFMQNYGQLLPKPWLGPCSRRIARIRRASDANG